MSILGKPKKQPAEERFLDINLSADLLPGDAVSGSTVSVACISDAPDGTLLATVTAVSVTSVRLFVTGGTNGKDYKVTVLTETAMGEKLEDEVIVRVRES